MVLKFSVASAQAASLGADAEKLFRLHGGSIGRGRDNDWVLPDTERIVSSRHARIIYDNGQFFLEDISTNGTFINHSDNPAPRGQPIPLTHGDVLEIGEYEIHVALLEDDAPGVEGIAERAYPASAEFVAKPYVPPAEPARPDKQPYATPSLLDALPDTEEPADHGTASDHLPAEQEGFVPPRASRELMTEAEPMPVQEVLPADWWQDSDIGTVQDQAGSPAVADTPAITPPAADGQAEACAQPQAQPQTAPPTKQNTPGADEGPGISPHDPDALAAAAMTAKTGTINPLPTEPAGPNEHAAPSVTAADTARDIAAELQAAFFQGAGLEPEAPDFESQAAAVAWFNQLGRIMRVVTQGTLDVLHARSMLKSEFRLSQTIVRATQNNPLKFTVDTDAALQQLFEDNRPGLLNPEAAFAEAMQDIKSHEMAVVAGMRAAFECLLERFEPGAIEAKCKAQDKLSSLGLGNKPWKCYKQFYEAFKASANDDFQGIFGSDFVRAYEEQIRLLSAQWSEDHSA